MVQVRKKKELDGTDREILRILYSDGAMVGSRIGKLVGLSPPAIAPRLNSLLGKGILKKSKILGVRKFRKKISGRVVHVSSPRGIYWEIDLKK